MHQVTQLENPEDMDIKNHLDITIKGESLSDRDAGFYSGEDTDLDVQYHSPMETSRNSSDTCKESVDSQRNKRKSSDPKRIRETFGEPEIKRVKLDSEKIKSTDHDDFYIKSTNSSSQLLIRDKVHDDISSIVGRLPFRPWNVKSEVDNDAQSVVLPKIPFEYLPSLISPYQEEPLALVVEKKRDPDDDSCNKSQFAKRLPRFDSRVETDELIQNFKVGKRLRRIDDESQTFNNTPSSRLGRTHSHHNRYASSSSTTSSSEDKYKSSHTLNSGHQKQRNYKNMTRKRRIEANARERTRVHLISDAFRTLRKCVPAYADNQKLSKLSVLRIACSYIMTLSRIAGYDYSADQSAPSVADCIGSVSSTIQMEGKTKKKKEE